MERLQAGDPRQMGPYRLLGRLGEGGMGRVFLGVSPGGRKVAIKVVHPHHGDDPEFRRRFQREVGAARQVNVLYTAAVVDADSDGPIPWLATEYVDAPSLASAVRDSGPLSPAALRALAAGLAEGLSAIHGAGLVHRDLKPSNVLLAADGPRVIDFGIACTAEASSLTRTNVVVGSPGYMSPEQAEPNRVVGPPSDVFSLGAVLCYAAAGRGPWGTGSTASLIYRVVHAEPDIADLPDEIRSLVTRCMAKDPADRPTAADIVAELCARGLAGGPLAESSTRQASPTLAATPPTAPPAHYAPPRPPKRRRRRRLGWLVAAAAAAAVAVPVVIAQAQTDPGGSGQSDGQGQGQAPGHPGTAGPAPALLGVYSGPEYGFNRPNSIAADGRHIWVLNGGDDSVTELDARTGTWIRTLRAASYGFKATSSDTAGIVDDGTNVWVGNENSVTEINGASGALIRTLRIPASANIHGWYSALVRAGTRLWGVSPDTCRPYCDSASHTGFYASAIEFNASDGSYARAVSRGNTQAPVALATDGAHIWMVGSDVNGNGTAGTVTELDASDGRQLWSTATTVYSNQQATTYDSITYADGFLWVANGESVTQLNASTGKQVRVLSGAHYQLDVPTVVAAAGTNVFIVNSAGNSVTEVDARTGALVHTLSAARYRFYNPASITVAGNHAWILNSPSAAPGSVVEIAF